MLGAEADVTGSYGAALVAESVVEDIFFALHAEAGIAIPFAVDEVGIVRAVALKHAVAQQHVGAGEIVFVKLFHVAADYAVVEAHRGFETVAFVVGEVDGDYWAVFQSKQIVVGECAVGKPIDAAMHFHHVVGSVGEFAAFGFNPSVACQQHIARTVVQHRVEQVQRFGFG